jgi:hypothetical protein
MKKFLFFMAVIMTWSAGAYKPAHVINHKFYLSVTKVNYNAEQKALQLVTRAFIDDIELAIQTRYGVALNLDTEQERTLLVNGYFQHYIKRMMGFNADEISYSPNFAGYTYDGDQIVLLTEFAGVHLDKDSDVTFENRLLTGLFDEQQNLTHFYVFGEKKSKVLSKEDPVFKWDLASH